MIAEEQIGPRIRQLRIARGLTVAALAEKAGLSRGYVSKVENSKTSPPVSTLMTLAKALGVNISEVFSEEITPARVTIVRKSERQPISRPGSSFGYSYEPLAPTFPQRHMDPYILTIPPNRKGTRVFQHKGEEMLLVLEGAVVMTINGEDYTLEEGDCIYWDASLPHLGRVFGNKETKCVVVIYGSEQPNPGKASHSV
jgi:transcriptional regulator with XRE-family HTH domain